MSQREPSEHEQWEDIVQRLGGTPEQAQTPPSYESFPEDAGFRPGTSGKGPRDYQLADEVVEDFEPPDPKPIASGNPRTILSWSGVVISAVVWIIAAIFSWQLPWWLTTVTILGFFGGTVSLFFLLPKSWAHRERFDGDDYGDGARL